MNPQPDIPLSPFLPGTKIQYAWDSTSLGYIKTCPRLYQYNMIEGWSPKDESVHLRFGGEYHSAIEDFEKAKANGTNFDDAVRLAVHNLLTRIRDWDPDTTSRAGRYKNPRTLLQLVVDYFDEYRDDPCKTFILDNGAPAIELSFKFELDWGPKSGQMVTYIDTGEPYEMDLRPGAINMISSEGTSVVPTTHSQPYLLCGHLDRVVDWNGDLFVLDHKTTTTTPSQYYFDSFDPNNQMTLYSFAGKVVLNATIKGVVIEAAQILLEKPNNFKRGFTYRTEGVIDEWIENLEHWLHMAEHYAENEFWPMNDTACDKFGGCKFKGVCSKDAHVRHVYLNQDFVKLEEADRWNPLKSR